MLSKYYHLEENNFTMVEVDMSELISTLIRVLKKDYTEIRMKSVCPGGTLGIFFELYIDGKRKFVKTHQVGETYRKNLIKEIEIMSLIYKEIIEIERADTVMDGNPFTFMIMDYLVPGNYPINLKEVKDYIDYYQERLTLKELNVKYSFNNVIQAGSESIELLFANNFFSDKVYTRCKESIKNIKHEVHKLLPAICHGDLSNVNIMYTQSGKAIVIDWEDSLLAFNDYDFLYWLTFFSQRKYYVIDTLEACNADKALYIDVMVLITVVKSQMSFKNGSYKKNSLSFQERINEIYNIID